MKTLLELKKRIQKKMPNFVRKESKNRKEIGSSWRRPRGQCNKQRRCMQGHATKVKKGFRVPKQVRGLSKEGKEIILLTNTKQLETLDAHKHTVIIARNIGAKKQLAIITTLTSKGISIHNIKNIEEHVNTIKNKQEEKKKTKLAKEQEKATNKKKEDKTTASKARPDSTPEHTKQKDKKKETKEHTEETEEKEKKDLDKLLTKKT